MKIAMISEHASPLATFGGVDAGGQNVHVAELSAALVERGHTVIVYTRRDDAHLAKRMSLPSGVRLVHLRAGPPKFVAKDFLLQYMDEFAVQLRRDLARERVDVVHAHFWMSGRAALAAARALGIPVVQTFHALGSEKRRFQGAADTSPGTRLLEEQAIVRRADFIVATASAEATELRRMGSDMRRVRVVPCGVNLAHFDADASVLPLARSRRHRIVTLSRLVERKGVDDVIRALADIPDAELLVAGGGEASELELDPECQRLSEIARRHHVADRVRMYGRVERRDVPRLLRSADCVVCAPWYEPFGIVPLEAMACRRPVVASAVGGLRDTVVHEVTGLRVPSRSPHEIAAAVNKLLQSPRLRDEFGAAGRARVEARYTWERVAEATENVYCELSAQRRIDDTA